MNILFIHQNFPAQFVHLSAELAKDPNNRVVALSMNERPVPAGVEARRYSLVREPAPETHPLLLEQEGNVLRAEACAAAAFQLKREGFVPDVIVAHPGWGEALFIKEVFPAAKLVVYCEYYYALEGQDVGFDPEMPAMNFQQQARLRLRNTCNLHSLQIADAAISPTEWQKSTYPAWAQDMITVIHDGIDTDRLRFNPQARVAIQSAAGTVQFQPGAEVLTYVARNLEPVRGFHQLMRALPKVLAQRPNAHAIIVGGSDISYGARASSGLDWKSHMLEEVGPGLDRSRVHFVGKVPYSTYLDLLSISRVHAYWTTPFVLSWSLLEAALSGAPVLASRTAPIEEFAEELSIKTFGFHDHAHAAELMAAQLAEPTVRKAVAIPQRLQLRHCVQAQLDLVRNV
jgi:glycosyltransferase involved in cell wall biosynthesis